MRPVSMSGPRDGLDLGIEGLSEILLIGSGGNASVYRARQSGFDRVVAVKVLTVPIHDDASRRRFEREQSLTGRLTGHPNIARVYTAAISSTGHPYLLMEYYKGGSIEALIRRTGPVPLHRVLATGVKMAGALATAHGSGILHRDMKPANILLDAYGEPVLADFGIAGLASQGPAMSTAFSYWYAAPETLEETGDATEASDQYSLALTLWAMLAGGTPWASVAERRLALLPAKTPSSAVDVLQRALAFEPSGRYASVTSMAEALQQVQIQLSLPLSELRVGTVDEPLDEQVLDVSTNSVAQANDPSQVVDVDPTRRGLKRAEQVATAAEPIGKSRRVPTWIWAVGGLLVVAFVAGAGISVSNRLKGEPAPSTTASSSATPTNSADLIAVDDLEARPVAGGEKVRVVWTDPNNPKVRYLLSVIDVSDGTRDVVGFLTVRPGLGYVEVPIRDVGGQYCFQVNADATGGPPSNRDCVNGGVWPS